MRITTLAFAACVGISFLHSADAQIIQPFGGESRLQYFNLVDGSEQLGYSVGPELWGQPIHRTIVGDLTPFTSSDLMTLVDGGIHYISPVDEFSSSQELLIYADDLDIDSDRGLNSPDAFVYLHNGVIWKGDFLQSPPVQPNVSMVFDTQDNDRRGLRSVSTETSGFEYLTWNDTEVFGHYQGDEVSAWINPHPEYPIISVEALRYDDVEGAELAILTQWGLTICRPDGSTIEAHPSLGPDGLIDVIPGHAGGKDRVAWVTPDAVPGTEIMFVLTYQTDPQWVQLGAIGTVDLAVGDMTEDGVPDVAVSHSYFHDPLLLLQTSSGAFVNGTTMVRLVETGGTTSLPVGLNDIVIANLDSDPELELYYPISSGEEVVIVESFDGTLALNNDPSVTGGIWADQSNTVEMSIDFPFPYDYDRLLVTVYEQPSITSPISLLPFAVAQAQDFTVGSNQTEVTFNIPVGNMSADAIYHVSMRLIKTGSPTQIGPTMTGAISRSETALDLILIQDNEPPSLLVEFTNLLEINFVGGFVPRIGIGPSRNRGPGAG